MCVSTIDNSIEIINIVWLMVIPHIYITIIQVWCTIQIIYRLQLFGTYFL